jgi:hypothetical protein
MAGGDADAMASLITDEMLDAYAVTATWDELPGALLARYRGVADRVFSYGPAKDWVGDPELRRRWQAVATAVTAAR